MVNAGKGIVVSPNLATFVFWRKLMLRKTLVNISIIFFMAVLAAGCASNIQSYSEEGMDLMFYKRVAILPLENNSADEFSDERFGAVLSTAVLTHGQFEVVEKGDLKLFLREEVAGSDVTTLDKGMAQALAKQLKVEAYIAGSVDLYEVVRNGPYSYPVVAATLRMIDTKSGQIIWQANGSESGYTTSGRVFGFASEDIHQVSLRLANSLIQTMR